MNKHFEDAMYYLRRAGEHATEGIKEELAPLEARFREMTGNEKAPDESRLDRLQADLEELQKRAEGEAKEAIQEARERIRTYRESSGSSE